MARHITKTGYERIALAISLLHETYEKQYKESLRGPDNSKSHMLRGKVLGVEDTAYYLSEAFEIDNPKFDKDKFKVLCGTKSK